jgi:DNA helicase HerA-like ATPase
MHRVGKVDFFDGNKRKVNFFVQDRDHVEEEGFYKIISGGGKIFYIFVTNLCEVPLDSEMRARYSPHDYSFDKEERYVLYAHAAVLVEYREKPEKKKIIGYKTIPQHNDEVYKLETSDFDVLGLPKLEFAHVRSGSERFDTKAGFRKDAYITHWLLCGWTNSGKTNSAKVLLGVTIKGDENGPFAGGVVIDPHGEYYDELKRFNDEQETRVMHLTLNPDPQDRNEKSLLLSTRYLTPSHLTAVYDFKEDTQLSFMYACQKAKGKKWVRYIREKEISEIDSDGFFAGEGVRFVIGAVKRRVESIFRDDDIWTYEKSPVLAEILSGVSNGKWYVIDVSSVSDRTAKLITSMLSSKIFYKYKMEATKNRQNWRTFKPAGILVEEAHNYLSSEESRRGNIVARIAKEGRKFKVFSIVVEQDPGGIDSRILKQIHNKVILQLIPQDAKIITETTPYTSDLEKKIPYYSTGEGLFISTGSFNFALPVKFPTIEEWLSENSTRCKVCGRDTMSSVRICANCQKLKSKEDLKAFM